MFCNIIEDTLGIFSKDFNQCDSSSTTDSAILNVLFTRFRLRDKEAKEVYLQNLRDSPFNMTSGGRGRGKDTET